jgi:sRNA-binding carbon storage regulator CsrA
MLVLSRKIDEEIYLVARERIVIEEGETIAVINLLRLGADTARIGIKSPQEVKIMRGELIEQLAAVAGCEAE